MSLRLGLAFVCLAACACDALYVSSQVAGTKPVPAPLSGHAERPAFDTKRFPKDFELCDQSAYTCLDSQTLAYCSPTGSVASDCTAICQSAGFARAQGCSTAAQAAGDTCYCADLPLATMRVSGRDDARDAFQL